MKNNKLYNRFAHFHSIYMSDVTQNLPETMQKDSN